MNKREFYKLLDSFDKDKLQTDGGIASYQDKYDPIYNKIVVHYGLFTGKEIKRIKYKLIGGKDRSKREVEKYFKWLNDYLENK